MKHFFSVVICCLISLSSVTEFIGSQPLEKKADGWVDVLRSDSRLKVTLNVSTDAWTTPQQLLETLKKATGVTLSWAGDGDSTTVILGNMQVVNVPAWRVLEQVAKGQLNGGKWEQAGDGYRLHGTPKDFGPAPRYGRSDEGKAARKVFEEKAAVAAQARDDFAKYHPLGLDLRVRARVTVVEREPKLADLLARLAKATGVELTLASNILYHSPDLGAITLRDVGAYTIMELVASADLDGGRWEKTDTGYRLEGVSRALRPPPSRFGWGWAVMGGVTTLTAAGALVMWRRRCKTAASADPNAAARLIKGNVIR